MFDVATYILLKKYVKGQRIDKIEVDDNGDIIVTLKNGEVLNVGPFPECELYWTDIK
jgi:hypothetical protein